MIKILKPNIEHKDFDANLFRKQMKNNSCIKNYKLTNRGLTALTKTLSIKGRKIGKFDIKIDFYGKTSKNKLYQFHEPLVRVSYYHFIKNKEQGFDYCDNDCEYNTHALIGYPCTNRTIFEYLCLGDFYKDYTDMRKSGNLYGCLMLTLKVLAIPKNSDYVWSSVFNYLDDIILPNLTKKEIKECFGGKAITEDDVNEEMVKQHLKEQKSLRRLLRC